MTIPYHDAFDINQAPSFAPFELGEQDYNGNYDIVTIGAEAGLPVTHKPVHNITKGQGWDYWQIQPAVDDANSGDVIVIDPGTYTENIAFPSTTSHATKLTIKSNSPTNSSTVAGTIIQGVYTSSFPPAIALGRANLIFKWFYHSGACKWHNDHFLTSDPLQLHNDSIRGWLTNYQLFRCFH